MKTLTDSRGTQINTDMCVDNVENRFDLVLIASARARELLYRHKRAGNPNQLYAPVTALLEIQNKKIGREYLKRVK